ncbi:PDZ domain-containing protein 8-like [Dermacentor albipictus]|uniref:PDZ domain-containing protein 8-like n=1 Tax=Dermacentor albipictus TaxID=60249 RepID=UPI0031FC0D7E
MAVAVFAFWFLFGAAVVLLVQAYYIFRVLALPALPREKVGKKYAPATIPQKLLKAVKAEDWKKERDTLLVANLASQFLFREWKESALIRRVSFSKINKAFRAVLRGPASKVLSKLQIREIDFGNDFVSVNKIAVESVTLHEIWKTIEELDMFCSFEYPGGFSIGIDAELNVGAQASVVIKVNRLAAKGRLQFSRKPYTHWSFALYEEPKVSITVESSLQGQNYPQFARAVTGLVRRKLRSKFNLPTYVIAIKPFFLIPELRVLSTHHEKLSQTGTLEITVVECSRLVLCEGSFQLYCMISLDELEWIDMDEVLGTPWQNISLELFKPVGVAIGVEFRNKTVEGRRREVVYVESLTRNSPLAAGGLMEGDLIAAIEGVRIVDFKQAAKVLSKAGEQVVINVERKKDFKWDKLKALSSSPPPEHEEHTVTQDDKTKISNKTADLNTNERPEKRGDSAAILMRAKNKGFPIKRTTYVLSNREPVFLESFSFEVKNHYRFINVGVWSKGQIISQQGVKKPRIDTMLGYTAIPVSHVLEECLKTTEGYHGEVVKLLCPHFTRVPKEFHKYATLSGFDPRHCYGDITLRFLFKGEYKVKGSQLSFERTRDTRDDEPAGPVLAGDQMRPVGDMKSMAHDFEDVIFKKATTCKFCNNRIWLSRGMRCKVCRMIIHSKCHHKAMQLTLCKQKMWPEEEAEPVGGVHETSTKEEQEMRLLANVVKAQRPAQSPVPKTKAVTTVVQPLPTQYEDDFFKQLEMTDNASRLEEVLRHLSHRGFGMELFSKAVTAAKHMHSDLKPQARMERVRNVYQRVKVSYEAERQRKDKLEEQLTKAPDEATRQALRPLLEQCEQRLKGLNLVLLYYASGLKHIYEEHEGSGHSEAPA